MSVRTIQQHRHPMLPQILHDNRQRGTMMTREDESMSLKHQFHQLFKNEVPLLNPVSFDMETRNDEIAADVPLPEKPAEVSGDQPQGWITEEAFLTVLPGARQIRNARRQT